MHVWYASTAIVVVSSSQVEWALPPGWRVVYLR